MSTTDQDERTVEELRDELRDRDLKVSGTKEELIARLADHGPDNGATSNGDGARPGLREVTRTIREELSDVLGLHVERVTGLTRGDAGWRARADVVEMRRIPPSTDVLATYEVTVEGDGSVGSFERVRRFQRSQGEDDR